MFKINQFLNFSNKYPKYLTNLHVCSKRKGGAAATPVVNSKIHFEVQKILGH